MEAYIKTKLDDYLYELSLNNFIINSWRKLELITAYKNKALLYEDVPEHIKEKYDLPSRDEGIDVVKLENETIIETYQCKDYNGYVSNHSLGTYFGFHLYKLIGIPFNVVGSINSIFNSMITPIIYDTNEILEYNHDIKPQTQNVLDSLRWYQKEAIDLIEKVLYDNINKTATNNEVRIKIPCGCGKTAIMYYFGLSCLKILILVPKINIGEQIQDYFETTLNKKCNCYWTNNITKLKSNVTICVYNSVDHIINKKFDIVFIDEAHHIIGSKLYKYYDSNSNMSIDENSNSITNGYLSGDIDEDTDETTIEDTDEDTSENSIIKDKSIHDSFITKIQNLNSTLKVYLSATIDVKNIENSFELSFDKAINEGYLSDYEFNILYVDSEFDTNYNQLVEIINENKEYKHIILYCNRIETAKSINKLLNNNNIISSVITSEERKSKRNRILNDFQNNLIKVLCSVNCLNEGTDLPIADTCMFINDRGSEINIIQCIGRILRKHKFKNKARIVLFDSNPNDAELKYEYYLHVLDKIDSSFKTNIKHKLKLYNYTHDIRFNIIEKQNQYFNKITRFRLSWEDKLKLCQKFHDEYKRLPKYKEFYKNFCIGYFIQNIRYSNNQDKINQLKEIFGEHYIDKNIKYTFEDKLELCKQFHNKFRKFPLQIDKYNNWNIGRFVHTIKNSKNKDKINQLKEIFGEHYIDSNNNIKYTFEDKLELCKQFHNEFKRLPKRNEKYDDFNIGYFIKHIKYNKNNLIRKQQLEEIFHCKFD